MKAPQEIVNAVQSGQQTLGEIITWSAGGDVTFTMIRDALKKAGMDETIARELCPRYAFSRACKEMEQGRIIRMLKDEPKTMLFQFTREALNEVAGLMEYNFETTLEINKKTGKTTCVDKSLEELADRLIQDKTEARTSSDVTNIVQRMFAKHADLFPVREKGGCYFVPKCYSDFVDSVENFLNSLGGHINRFPILAGTARGTQSVKTVVAQGLLAMVEDHRKAIERLGASTMDSTFESRLQSIDETRYKLEGYALFLGDQVNALYEAVDLAKQELTAAKLKLVDAAVGQ